jgi:hypothetical protein
MLGAIFNNIFLRFLSVVRGMTTTQRQTEETGDGRNRQNAMIRLSPENRHRRQETGITKVVRHRHHHHHPTDTAKNHGNPTKGKCHVCPSATGDAFEISLIALMTPLIQFIIDQL